jgi:Haem-NO-binding
MFGWINDCTESLVCSAFGEEAWHKIKEKAGCTVEDGGFLRYKYYDDSDTVDLVVAASEVLNITVDEVLHAFGDYFVGYVKVNGYGNVLECLGSNLRDWLSNLNSLHDHLQASYPKGFVAPVFWSEDDVEFELSTAGAESNAILVHYFSHRGSLLVPLVVGLIKRVALDYFSIEITMEQLQLQDEAAGVGQTTWRVTTAVPHESHKLRGQKKRKKRAPKNHGDDDEATVTTAATSKTNYHKTFLEGGAQAAMLRVEELVKRSFFNEECELYHALTLEQYLWLIDEWNTNLIDDKRCFEIWSMENDNPASWPSIADLPAKLNPATIDPLHFGGQVPATGRFPPDASGNLQGFPRIIQVFNKLIDKSVNLSFAKAVDLDLETAILNSKIVEDAGLKHFPGLEDRIDNGEYEIQCIVWNQETESLYHAFALGDLKMTSTLQLFELVPKTFDPIVLVLECVDTISVDEDEEDI